MTQAAQQSSSPVFKQVSRRTMARSLVTAALLVSGAVALRGLEAALHATFNKPPAPLTKPLAEMKKQLGSPVRYEAAGPDIRLEEAVVEALGTTDYLMREYTDKTLKEGEVGRTISLNLNYYPTGSSTPHVPEVCWAGQGHQEAPESRTSFAVENVHRRDGSTTTLHVNLISFIPQKEELNRIGGRTPEGEPVYTNVAYVFHVNGAYVANPQEVSSQFWKAAYKYAYHAKIEMTPMLRAAGPGGRGESYPLVCTRTQAKRVVSEFLKSSLADIEECLPDPAILTGGTAGESKAR